MPIKEVRQEIEAAAGGSVRIADNAAAASGDSQQSLTALLSDSKNDWLIDEKDLEIAVDERGRPIKLGSGSFGTVSPAATNLGPRNSFNDPAKSTHPDRTARVVCAFLDKLS